MNTKNNRQFQTSDVRMKQAMLELLNTTPFEKITVRLICDRAQINRSTFYAHYADINDMIRQMENNLQKELLKEYPGSAPVAPLSLESLIPFLRFIHKHENFYRSALKAWHEFPIPQGEKALWDHVIQPLCLKAGITCKQEILYYFVGFKAGFTMILKHWLEQGCAESEETVARIIRNLVPSIWKTDTP